MLKLNHKKLDVYSKSIELVGLVYDLTKSYPNTETYALSNQMRRAAVSIPSNIAEGASRNSELDRKRFYRISRSSLVELDTHIEISKELKYVTNDEIKELEVLGNRVFAMLSRMIS